ncbi:hypothetical protein [Algoriphagus aquimarinus]|uniref:hypothetical protein n=1 Tax=Algoriphagus aquimarinus TaxID=237018 RepID=UPI0030D78735|tara:strand:- start:1120 stop:1758 length:639 start_codon:yes stop_codon:yes gene_type:complete
MNHHLHIPTYQRPQGQVLGVPSADPVLKASGKPGDFHLLEGFVPRIIKRAKARLLKQSIKKFYSHFSKLMRNAESEDHKEAILMEAAWGFAPLGTTTYSTNEGGVVFVDKNWNAIDPEIDIDTYELNLFQKVKNYCSESGSSYLLVLIAVLNRKIQLFLFKLTPPFPKDQSDLSIQTLICQSENILVAHKGFLFFSLYRPPPQLYLPKKNIT